VYFSPFDVRLNADTLDDTVVQPDILVICDSEKLDPAGCKGAPEFLIEILSPSTSSRDRHLKFSLYRRVGVKEYWIVEPDTQKVSTHILSNGDYITRIYGETDTVPISVLEGCTIDLAEVFS
jgi:Uma2 family endonuclease